MYTKTNIFICNLFNFIHQRRSVCILFFALLSIFLNSVSVLINGIPKPRIHDEFSYILGAETFAQGRMTNPVHPLSEFFDTFHVISSPTRMSIYPPAQSLFLALGIILFGHPIAGVWISIALMCGVLCWMFYAWLPSRWAFVASFLVLLHLGFYTYWSHTYWGGAVAAIGGGLAFGGLRYFYLVPSKKFTFLIGLGYLILANSRPLEGFLLGIIITAALIPFVTSNNFTIIKKVKLLSPMVILSLITVVQVGFYNEKITGNPFSMPQRFLGEQLTTIPLFIWQKHPPEPELKCDWKTDYIHNFVLPHYYEKLKKYPSTVSQELKNHINFYSGFFLLSIVLLTLPVSLRDHWYLLSFISIIIIILFDVFFLNIDNQPHYLAPLSGVIFYCIAQSMRSVFSLKTDSYHTGKLLITNVFVIMVLISIFNLSVNRCRPGLFQKNQIQKEWYWYRADFEKRLKNQEGKHVVMVPYGPDHNIHKEWVYNAPIIDEAKVVWARYLDSEKNRKLFTYFHDRKFWIVLNENSIPELVQYIDKTEFK